MNSDFPSHNQLVLGCVVSSVVLACALYTQTELPISVIKVAIILLYDQLFVSTNKPMKWNSVAKLYFNTICGWL